MNINLICDGKTLEAVTSSGTTFFCVEPEMHGKPFTIQLRHQSSGRKAVFIGVDGKCVQTGKDDWTNPRADMRAYLVEPYRTMELKGFRTSEETVGEFVFTDVERSYAAQTGTSENSRGTIGLEIWGERAVQRNWGGALESLSKGGGRQTLGRRSMSYDAGDDYLLGASLDAMAAPAAAAAAEEVGVGFGNDVQSKVTEVSFNWGSMERRMTFRYATRAQLESWGLIHPKPPAVNAFPKPAPETAQRPPVSPY
jgi:hypothetical protein